MIEFDVILANRCVPASRESTSCMLAALVFTAPKPVLATCGIFHGSWWSIDVQLQLDEDGENL
jgi:hypothetical protein